MIVDSFYSKLKCFGFPNLDVNDKKLEKRKGSHEEENLIGRVFH